MGRISSSVGLISGINSRDIIDQLMSIESQPKTNLQARIDKTNEQKLAFTDLSTRLTSLRISSTTLKKPSTFTQATATSSDENVLTAVAGAGASVGSYTFQVARMVTSQQMVTRGFADSDKTTVGAGTITLEMGGGDLNKEVSLTDLRGGQGVRRGVFRITDRTGKTANIDISAAVSLDDVVKKINTSLDIGVKAKIGNNGLELEDTTSGNGSLTVQDLAGGHAAQDLGIANDFAASTTASHIGGATISFLGRSTALAGLNDGRGVHQTDSSDFEIVLGATNVNVDLTGAQTIGQVIDRINADGTGKVKASINASATGIELTDLTGSGSITVNEIGSGTTAADLGLLGTTAGATHNGRDVLGALNSVSLAALNGGQGMLLGQMQITDRRGISQTVDLSAATTVQDVLDTINNSGLRITAGLNSAGNGIQITDESGQSGDLIIAEAGDDTAAQLGLLGTFDTATVAAVGKNLQRQWVSSAMLLKDYNGGKGVGEGSFSITAADGHQATIDTSKEDLRTLGDLINAINKKGIGVVASINENGDGLLLTDNSGGASKMKVTGITGTTAKDLRLEGQATTNTIDGSFELSIDVSATDTLAKVQQKINDSGFGAFASIINDGSSGTPFRLTLNARNGGNNGRFSFDAGATGLAASTLVQAQDAAVFLGNSGSEQPLMVTSNQNQLTGVIPGVTLDLHSVSNGPVTLTISATPDKAIETLTKLTDTFNELITKITDLTKWDSQTNTGGLLLGDTTVVRIQNELFQVFSASINGAGKYRMLAQIGLRYTNGELTFDEDKFRQAYADDAESVNRLFTSLTSGVSEQMLLTAANEGRGVRTLGEGQDDFQVNLKDGTSFNVSLGQSRTLRDVIDRINTAAGGKLKADLSSDGRALRLSDLSNSGAGTFSVQNLSGSQAAFDLGLMSTATDGIITGKTLGSATKGGGIAYELENRINRLIDPVSGVVTRENRKLDSITDQYQDRIKSLDKLLQGKRERLERQFAQMESVLANLQNQQQSLGSLQNLMASPSRSK